MDEIELVNVSKNIKKKVLFDKVNLNLEKGKIYGLVGENGSGKSTIIKMLLNMSKFEGEIIVSGFNIRKEYKSIASKISAVVDFISLYEFLTAYENLRYFSLLYNVNKERVDEVLKIVKLKKDSVLVKNYSLGMKQRLGIAISLLKNPDILILDEPTNGLDPKGIRGLRELLLSFKNKTIIVSSHLISEIEKISTNILFINDKKIEQKNFEDTKRIRFVLGKRYIDKKLDEGKLSDIEINNYVNKLVNNNIPIYRIEEKNEIEDMLINMMGESND